MSGEADGLSEQQVNAWLSPSAAINELHHLDNLHAAITLIQALQYGLVRAAAMTAAITIRGTRSNGGLLAIPSSWWRDLAARNLFWKNGQIVLHGLTISHNYDCEAALFDVRLDPKQVRALVPASQRQVVSTESEPASTNRQPEERQPEGDNEIERGPRVADAHLKEWWELYRKAYRDAEDTGATALKSARGMFPGKYVARSRVRELRGARPRGRKPTSTP